MTTKIITIQVLALIILGVSVGVSFAQASEVLGTLSSQTASTSQANGLVEGDVIGSSLSGNVSGGSGGSSGGRGRSLNSSPSGALLSASTESGVSPAFPNAGTANDGTSQPVKALAAILIIAGGYLLFLKVRNVTNF